MPKQSKNSKPKAVKLTPLGDRALIKELKADDRERVTDSGIIIPETVSEDKGAKQGEVVAVGPGRYDEEHLIPMSVKVGDKVLFQWGDTVKIDGEEYVLASESNILAVIK